MSGNISMRSVSVERDGLALRSFVSAIEVGGESFVRGEEPLIAWGGARSVDAHPQPSWPLGDFLRFVMAKCNYEGDRSGMLVGFEKST